MITRTFKTPLYTVKVLNEDDTVTTINCVEIPESITSKGAKLQYLCDKFGDVIRWSESDESIEVLYGMDEELFKQYAVILDPETRKPVTANN